jgi:phage gp29-like protein
VAHSDIRDDFLPPQGGHNLKPSKLGQLMRDAEAGDTRAQYEMFSVVEEDPHLHSVLSKRRLAVTGKTLQILPVVDDDAKAQQAADLCCEMIFGDELGGGGIPGWTEALFDVTDAIGRGFSLLQIVWGLDGGKWRVQGLEYWPQRDCILGTPSQPFAQNADEVKVITADNVALGEPLAPGQWILHKQKARSAPLAQAALLRTVSWFYLFKRFSFRDWAIFNEAYGMPRRVGKYPAGASDPEREAVKRAVIALGRDGAAVIPQGAELEFLKALDSASALPFPEMVRICDEQISKAIVGQTLTTESGTRGARSLGEVHESVQHEIMESDCRAVAETLRRDLLTPLVRFNLGDAPVPKCEFLVEEDEDLKSRSERDVNLVGKLGLPVARKYFYETYDIPEPEEGEELIAVPAPVPFPGGPDEGKGQAGAKAKPNGKPAPVEPDADDTEDAPPLPNAAWLDSLAEQVLTLAQKKSSQRWVR